MRAWVVVASAEHAFLGARLGFTQACHGKAAPLRRMAEGDGIVCYAPTRRFGGAERLQAFVTLGRVATGAPWQVEMTPDFRPWRRAVDWEPSSPAPIRPLLGALSFTRGARNWGAPFRFGLFEIPPGDFDLIAGAMADQGACTDPGKIALTVFSN